MRDCSSPLYREYAESLRGQVGDFRLTIRNQVVLDTGGPRWTHEKFKRVGFCRQAFIEEGRCPTGTRVDGVFMVDADVILGPDVLRRLWEVDADVVYGVFWTDCEWGGFRADWPQVWDINPYGWTPECMAALRAPGINEIEVLGGGACTLIRGRGFESHYWPLLRSFERSHSMMAGEDRTFCLGLECRGIRQVAVTGLQITHRYGE